MAEYYGSDYIYSRLSTDSAITAIVSTAIYSARLIPEKERSLKTINFYTIDGFNGGLDYFFRSWSIDCRSDNEQESKNLAQAVFDNLNRFKATVGSYEYFSKCSIEATLPPLDDSDVYNTPVTVILRRR